MIRSGLDVLALQAVVATLAAVILVGLGFLYRPTRATLRWALAFILLMLGTFGSLLAGSERFDWADDVAMGLAFAAPALIWSGLRALRDVRSYAWIAVVQGLVSAAVIFATAGTPAHSLAYSLAYGGSTAMAALSALELLRRPERGTGMLLPLTLVSLVLPVVGVASITAAVISFGVTQHAVLPDVKVVGHVIYLVCGLVTLLHLSRYADGAQELRVTNSFATVLGDRMQRAAAAGDRSWSLLAISLDDIEPLRVAVGDQWSQRILARVIAEVRAAFPVEADIGPDAPDSVLVLLSRPDSVIRESIRDLLERLRGADAEQPIAIELSVSVGWATVRTQGFDVVALVDAAWAAMNSAREAGGNRWERDDEPLAARHDS